MPKVCLLLADGFEEIEATTVADVLRRAGVGVTLLGVHGLDVRGAHSIVIKADKLLTEFQDAAWDMVILPGGMPGARTLRDDAAVQSLIIRQAGRSKVAAICAAPIALGRAGVLRGKRATCYPGFENELSGAKVSNDAVVCDGNVITSRGPGTAIAFAIALVENLVSSAKAAEVRADMLAS
jgi:protein deglycase